MMTAAAMPSRTPASTLSVSTPMAVQNSLIGMILHS